MRAKGRALHKNGRSAFPRPSLILAAVLGLMALTLGACGTGEAATPASPDTDGPIVAIEDLAFEPETLAVGAGDTVTWTWNDGAIAHDVAGGGFPSESIA